MYTYIEIHINESVNAYRFLSTSVHTNICIHIYTHIHHVHILFSFTHHPRSRRHPLPWARSTTRSFWPFRTKRRLSSFLIGLTPNLRSWIAFTRYSFTSRLLFTNHPSFHPPRQTSLPTLVQYHCTIIGQYTTPFPNLRLYTIHHTILVITISCKGQDLGWCVHIYA